MYFQRRADNGVAQLIGSVKQWMHEGILRKGTKEPKKKTLTALSQKETKGTKKKFNDSCTSNHA